MLKRFCIFLFVFVLMSFSYSKVLATNNDVLEISNDYFSFTMPEETKGTYVVQKRDNGIFIIEKFSEKSGEGGFAFGLQIFKEPKDYAHEADIDKFIKIGELTDTKGTIYDMVLIKPIEIICGDGEPIESNFNRLYDFGDNVDVKAINGNKYIKNKGMRGEDLYRDVLNKHIHAINEKWRDSQYKNAGISTLYLAVGKNRKKQMKKIGYAYYDINSDGIDELFIGKISKGKSIEPIYDIYTIVDRKPEHAVSSSSADKYFVCNDNFLCREKFVSDNENIFSVNYFIGNSAKLKRQIEFMYNSNLNRKNPWFRTFEITNYQNISKETYDQGKTNFNEYKKFDYIPLREFK